MDRPDIESIKKRWPKSPDMTVVFTDENLPGGILEKLSSDIIIALMRAGIHSDVEPLIKYIGHLETRVRLTTAALRTKTNDLIMTRTELDMCREG